MINSNNLFLADAKPKLRHSNFTWRNSILFILLSVFLANASFSQSDIEQIIPLSPEAAAMARYDNVPVNLFTGVPNISIPLYTIETSFLTIPLALSYHAGGNKVETIAPWVGMGWSLGTIPSISRSIKGLPDENDYFTAFDGGRTIYGITFYSLKELHQAHESGSITTEQYEMYIRDAVEGLIDTEPDVYSYSIVGESGKFFWNQETDEFVTLSATNTIIEPLNASGTSFVITSSDGVKYTFDVSETTDGEETAWYASTIESHNGLASIQLEYYPTELTNNRFLNPSKRYIWIGGAGSVAPLPDPITSSTVQAPRKLKKITFDGGFVEFVRNSAQRQDLTGSYSLQKVRVKHGTNSYYTHEYDFTYDYLVGGGCSNMPESGNKWMILTELNKVSNPNSPEGNETHAFEYDESQVPPCRTSTAQDYWGYYNGATSNSDLIPTQFVAGVEHQGADRSVKENGLAEWGILKKITYPTKGYTEFTYENNYTNSSLTAVNLVTNSIELGGDDGGPPPEVTGNGSPTNPYTIPFTIANGPHPVLNGGNPDGGATVNVVIMAPPDCDLSNGASACAFLKITNTTTSVSYTESVDRSVYLPDGNYVLEASFEPAIANYGDFLFQVIWKSPGSSGTSSHNEPAAGIRIQQIRSYPSPSEPPVVKTFQYTDCLNCTESSGHFFASTSRVYADHFYYRKIPGQSCNVGIFVRLSSYSNTEQISEGGTHLGYETVFEIQENGTESSIKRTDFEIDFDDVDASSPFIREYGGEVFRGQTKAEAYYNNGVEADVVKRVQNFYQERTESESGIFGIKWAWARAGLRCSFDLGPDYTPTAYMAYEIPIKWKGISGSQTTLYNDVNPYQAISNYFYESSAHDFLTREEITTSTGEVVSTAYKYPQDYTTPSSEISALVTSNKVNAPIETITSREGTIISAQGVAYDLSDLLPKKFYSYPDQLKTPFFIPSADGTTFGSYETVATVVRRDNKGNILEYMGRDGISVAIIWGYSQTLPVAEVKNATYSTIEMLSNFGVGFDLGTSGLSTSQESTLRNLPTSYVTTFSYQTGSGMIKRIDPNGQEMSYEYDGFNRLKLVRDFDTNVLIKHNYHYKNQ